MNGISLLNPSKPTIEKAPAADLDYGFDWTEWLAERGDTIASASVTASGGLTPTPATHDGKVVSTTVSGGVDGTEGVLTCRITTVGPPARTDERSIWIEVRQR